MKRVQRIAKLIYNVNILSAHAGLDLEIDSNKLDRDYCEKPDPLFRIPNENSN